MSKRVPLSNIFKIIRMFCFTYSES